MTDFSSEQYKKVIEANNRRNEISSKVNTKWTPLSKPKIDFTKDSEYIRLFNRESANEREN